MRKNPGHRRSSSKKQAGQPEKPKVFWVPREIRKHLPNREPHSGKLSNTHLGLWLSKYVYGEGNEEHFKEEVKATLLRSSRGGKLSMEGQMMQRFVESIKDRQEQILEGFKQQGYRVESFVAKASSPVVVGLGIESVLEVNLRLHHTWGIPIIPGSALKGLARSVAAQQLDSSMMGEIFGEQDRAGKVLFFDALPQAPLRLRLDVMNAHFSDYYAGKDYPTEWQNPNPIFFLTVAQGTEFFFSVAAYPGSSAEVVHKAVSALKAGLSHLGIGAKTSAGYGFFAIS